MKENKTSDHYNSDNTGEGRKSRLDLLSGKLAAAPGLLMCLITAGMLAADVVLPSMADLQYTVYPLAYRLQTLIAVVCCLIYMWLRKDAYGTEAPGDKNDEPDISTLMFLAFALFIMISTFVNGFSRDAIFGVQFRYIGVFDLIVFMAVYMGLSRRTAAEGTAGAVLWGIVWTANLIDAAVLLSIPTDGIAAFENKEGLSAVFFHSNHYGYFLVIAVIISAGYYIYGDMLQMIAGIVSFGLNMVMLVFNRSLGCLIAVAAVLLIMLTEAMIRGKDIERRKAFILSVWLVTTLAALLVCSHRLRIELYFTLREAVSILHGQGNQYMGHGRWQLWELTADYIRQKPLLGYGCEGISEILLADSPAVNKVGSPHCEPLAYAAFFGIPAALFYLGGCISAIAKGLRRKAGAADRSDNTSPAQTGIQAADPAIYSRVAAYAAAGYFISSLFGVAVFYTAPFFFILLGAAAGCAIEERSI